MVNNRILLPNAIELQLSYLTRKPKGLCACCGPWE